MDICRLKPWEFDCVRSGQEGPPEPSAETSGCPRNLAAAACGFNTKALKSRRKPPMRGAENLRKGSWHAMASQSSHLP